MTASNLAVTLAQSGARTLLIDLDFRRPNVHNIFALTREVGLSNHLVGESEFADVVQPSGINGLDVVLCGHIPPNPAELLGSTAMKEFASKVREMYDWVVYDTPPVLSATDPVLVSTLVDQVALVVRAGMTSRDQVQRAIQMLGHVKANLIGVILNDVSASSRRYYHYRYDRKG
jgi:capsular exopolysaccharide synthesis family protein